MSSSGGCYRDRVLTAAVSILLKVPHIKATGKFLMISEPAECSKMPFLSLARTSFQRRGKSPISVLHFCLLKVPGLENFRGGPVAETPHSQCREPRFDPWSGNKISHAATDDPSRHS